MKDSNRQRARSYMAESPTSTQSETLADSISRSTLIVRVSKEPSSLYRFINLVKDSQFRAKVTLVRKALIRLLSLQEESYNYSLGSGLEMKFILASRQLGMDRTFLSRNMSMTHIMVDRSRPINYAALEAELYGEDGETHSVYDLKRARLLV
jgi:hypothetical protein